MMSKVQIVTDSSAGLSLEYIKENHIVVILQKILWDGKTLEDGKDITNDDFFPRLEASSTIPSTSQPSMQEFLDVYNKLAPDCDSILAILLSSGVSGTIASATAASAEFNQVPVEIVDTKTTSAALAFSVQAAVEALKKGKSLKEVKTIAETTAHKSHTYFAVDTLKYLHKGGRIGGASRYIGSALKIKPILYLDENGKIDALERVRTWHKAVERLVDLVSEQSEGKKITAGIIHAAAEGKAVEIREMLRDRVDATEIDIYDLSPVLGVHVGPGTVGIAFTPAF